tara:strand:+ start:4570 stop:4713 length:144 start_codon:yes stop_codon:yes gene_type:complete
MKKIRNFPSFPPKMALLDDFLPFQSCSAMRSAMRFQNVPDKAGVPIL